ncbi:hypothetical protein EVAR_47293_1 [Eumeta japonica]|uniref:Uncharacterized protein n=1 Tax=Eumeta variegata TaxID=151549 RepID=A0A4C1Z2H7_EUMVA|nr:hypothetical protein EVAR_47293_1 [Eumeta japonica]
MLECKQAYNIPKQYAHKNLGRDNYVEFTRRDAYSPVLEHQSARGMALGMWVIFLAPKCAGGPRAPRAAA